MPEKRRQKPAPTLFQILPVGFPAFIRKILSVVKYRNVSRYSSPFGLSLSGVSGTLSSILRTSSESSSWARNCLTWLFGIINFASFTSREIRMVMLVSIAFDDFGLGGSGLGISARALIAKSAKIATRTKIFFIVFSPFR